MKYLVIYKSKTGFTERYAQWIAKELFADIYNCQAINKEIFKDYDVIIYGGSLHAVGIEGIKLIKDNWNLLEEKILVVFAVGATPYREETVEEIKNNNFSREQLKKIQFFYLRGGFNYNKLPLIDKFLMKLLQLKLKRKKNLTADEKGMLNAYNKPVDFTRRENIEGIISYIRSIAP
jgi:menaquinone-dependent protoporphyrinogen IX oxidase